MTTIFFVISKTFNHSSKGSVGQPCCHSPHVATGDIIFDDRQLFKNGFLMKNTFHDSQILTKVTTEKLLLPRLWRMWQ
jgi:hypothetical protein